MGEMGERHQKVRTSSSKTNKSRGCQGMPGDCSSEYRSAYSKVAKRVGLKSSHHKKKIRITMGTDVT